MSIASQSRKVTGSSANRLDYRTGFLRDAHRLIARGYARLDTASLARTVEEDITDYLASAITDAIQELGSPRWMHRYFVVDDTHVRHPNKRGKKRPRVDIEIINVHSNLRPRFHFEAKRLGRKNGIGKYVGKSGLGCILSGEYAREQEDAGMLGYIQLSTCADWAAKIEKKLTGDRAAYQLRDGSAWEQRSPTPELADVFRTRHERPALNLPVDVYHTLLLFCSVSGSAATPAQATSAECPASVRPRRSDATQSTTRSRRRQSPTGGG
jgi:hypothetical protein